MVATILPGSRAQNLGPIARIPVGEGRAFRVDHRTVAVFHTREGEVFATQALCPHSAAPLADGIIGGRTVICPLHGRKFDLITGRSMGGDCEPLQTYAVFIDEKGNILLSLNDRWGAEFSQHCPAISVKK